MRKLIFTIGMLPPLDYFADQFCAACEKNGWDYTVAEMGKPLTVQRFAEWVTSGVPCQVVMFNNVGLWLKMGGKNFWEQHHVPVANILVDHRRAFFRYLDEPIRDLTFYCIDRNHARYIQRFYPLANAAFLPHGGNREGEMLPWEERNIDVLYLSSCQERQQFYHIDRLPDKGQSFYGLIIPALMEQDTVTCEAAIHSYLAQTGQADASLEKHLNEEFAFFCENHVRRQFKKTLIKALSDAHLHTEIYGEHWDDDGECYAEQICLHGRIPARDCNAVMTHAKIALNALPWFKDGSHERVYNAMLSGAVCVTDDSEYFRETLKDGENVVFYNRKHPEEAAEKIRDLLANPDRARQIAENGRLFAEAHCTWEARLRQIVAEASPE